VLSSDASRAAGVQAEPEEPHLGADRVRSGKRGKASVSIVSERKIPAVKKTTRARAGGVLTGRELEIMLLVAGGNTSRQIGEALFISPRTVEMHVEGSLLKLGCRTRAHAVRRLAELGTLPSGETIWPSGSPRPAGFGAGGDHEN
jgi:DNA-binding CsgD family transcriptional regulator